MLLGPLIQRFAYGERAFLREAYAGHRVRRQFGDAGEVLNRLVCGDAPRLIHAVQVSQIAGEAGSDAHEFIGELFETRGGDALLVSHRADELVVDGRIGVRVGHVEQLLAQFVGLHEHGECALLRGDAWHVEHGPAGHDATGGDRRGLLGGVVAQCAVDEQRMAGGRHVGGITHGVVDIAHLVFGVGVAVEGAIRWKGDPRKLLDGFRVAGQGIEHDIVDRTTCQPLDDHAAFHEDLCGWVDEAAENDLPFY